MSPAVHVVDLGASPCNVKVRAVKRLSDENINAEVKAAKIPFVLPSTENEIQYIKKTGPSSKKVYPCTPDRRTVTMVSPITNSVTKLPESSKVFIVYFVFFQDGLNHTTSMLSPLVAIQDNYCLFCHNPMN